MLKYYFNNNLPSNFIEIKLRHGCSPVNLLYFSEHLFLRASMEGCLWITMCPEIVGCLFYYTLGHPKNFRDIIFSNFSFKFRRSSIF